MSSNGKVFISHAVSDRALARLMVNFLKEAVGVRDSDIFCTSLPGHSIPLTEDFNKYIRAQIEEPAIVVALLTPSYLESLFCLMELGAAWSRALKTLAVVAPGVSFDTVAKTLGSKQAWSINDHSKLFEFRETFSGLQLEERSTATWEGKVAEWRKKLPGVLRGLPSARLVEKTKVESALSDAEAATRAAEEEISSLKRQLSAMEEKNVTLQARITAKDEGWPRVMIVEPERLIALDLEQTLKNGRYDVIGVARTNAEALALALAEKPDIIVTETQLADGSSGIDLIKVVYPRVDCFAIFVTAYPERLLTKDRPEPIDLITKPFSPENLLEKIAGATRFVLERRAQAGGAAHERS
ncbi:TIR domain-containing protein [Agrobacterium pusense]|uniref:TIR domain-containing protein n=1 Tax=Agrobacterium pusense TaxID=648995 RepID=UPI0021D1B75A|nr:TIR domain-containing protein [Agrobacterium pusense]UXT93300.1 TIR domain-containing protein [Agrobacterium pusense]